MDHRSRGCRLRRSSLLARLATATLFCTLVAGGCTKRSDDASKPECKKAIRVLVDGGRCTYSYVGGSYIVLHPDNPPSGGRGMNRTSG